MGLTKNHIFSTLFFLWVLFSFFSVGYNLIKVTPEVREWFFLTDNEKRSKLFGDTYALLEIIRSKTEENTEIAIFSPDIKTHYLSIYYLYPRKTIVFNNEKEFISSISHKKYNYVVSSNLPIDLKNYERIATSSSLFSQSTAYFYKKL